MKKTLIIILSAMFITPSVIAQEPNKNQELSGDQKSSCEALLCLSSSTRPGECSPSLNRYFSIKKKKLKDTLNARRSFLNLCPSASAAGMPSLVNTIVNAADKCTASKLNSDLQKRVRVQVCEPTSKTKSNAKWGSSTKQKEECTYQYVVVIDNNLPSYCRAYYEHEYTDIALPRYQGTPLESGKWVN